MDARRITSPWYWWLEIPEFAALAFIGAFLLVCFAVAAIFT